LQKLWKETKSYNIFQYLLNLTLLHKEIIGDFDGIIPILEEVQSGKFQKVDLNANRLETSYIVSSMAFAYFRAKQYERGLEYVEKNLEVFTPATSDWFDFYDVYFLLAVYSKNYNKAFEVIDAVFETKYFDKLPLDFKDKWKLYNAYIHFLHSGSYYLKNNYANILDSLPEYDKEREGFNVAVLVLQYLYYIDQRELNKLVEIRDELKQYMANHFKENFSYRTRTFLQAYSTSLVENEAGL
jgi:tetratricopeptide (TPR) repeat protein